MWHLISWCPRKASHLFDIKVQSHTLIGYIIPWFVSLLVLCQRYILFSALMCNVSSILIFFVSHVTTCLMTKDYCICHKFVLFFNTGSNRFISIFTIYTEALSNRVACAVRNSASHMLLFTIYAFSIFDCF
jgi:hypothetical protein